MADTPTAIITTERMGSHALLHLLHLSGPSLPVGGFAYSQGLEYAIDSGWIADEEALYDWLRGVLIEGLGCVDLPVLIRFAEAYRESDAARVNHWNQWLRANRETKELLFEDEQMGLALRRLLRSVNVVGENDPSPTLPTFASQFACAAVHYQIDTAGMLHGYAWSWLENQIAVASKVLPLGQTAGQQLLVRLMLAIEEAVNDALAKEDGALGSTLPGQVIASALHETQYSRLFRS